MEDQRLGLELRLVGGSEIRLELRLVGGLERFPGRSQAKEGHSTARQESLKLNKKKYFLFPIFLTIDYLP